MVVECFQMFFQTVAFLRVVHVSWRKEVKGAGVREIGCVRDCSCDLVGVVQSGIPALRWAFPLLLSHPNCMLVGYILIHTPSPGGGHLPRVTNLPAGRQGWLGPPSYKRCSAKAKCWAVGEAIPSHSCPQSNCHQDQIIFEQGLSGQKLGPHLKWNFSARVQTPFFSRRLMISAELMCLATEMGSFETQKLCCACQVENLAHSYFWAFKTWHFPSNDRSPPPSSSKIVRLKTAYTPLPLYEAAVLTE